MKMEHLKTRITMKHEAPSVMIDFDQPDVRRVWYRSKNRFDFFFHSIAKHSAVHGISKLFSLSLKIPLDSLILEILENYDSGVSIFPRDFRASCLNGEWCGDS